MLDDKWLAERLVADGLVSRQHVDRALAADEGDLSKNLISGGAIREAELLRFLGLQFQTRYVSTEKLSTAKVIQWVLDLLSLEFCEKHQVLPVRCDKQRTKLSVVTPDPSDQTVIEETKNKSGVGEVLAYVALPHAIEAGIRKYYRGDLHAFARMDGSLRQDYSEMLNIYEQRLIDFDGSTEDLPPEAEQSLQAFRHDEVVLDGDSSPGAEPPSSPAPASPAPASPAVSPAPAAPTVRLGGLAQVVQVLVDQLEQGHGWRSGHSGKVVGLVTELATKAGVPGDQLADLQLTALLHEVGKSFDRHLTAPSIDGDPAHREEAGSAHQIPGRLFASSSLAPNVLGALAALYERHDGKGVPGRMEGERIPLAARLIQVADAYCDLVDNPNAPGGKCDAATAINRLQEAAGRGLLDPTIAGHLAASRAATGTGRTGDRALVLIIDEDARSAALLEGQLKSAGFDAVVANTTGDAALVLLGEKVSLVLSEVDLKPMDGFTFLEWLRGNQRTSDIPFMFVSGRTNADDVNRGFELGAVDYIVKPFRPEVVLAKIKRTV